MAKGKSIPTIPQTMKEWNLFVREAVGLNRRKSRIQLDYKCCSGNRFVATDI
jgi:hypothetical protein